ncbi:MAG TPA: alpha/beta hydrolase-fold protein, partial [Acidobacteriaceae bacterium]|nr:alpha/beta hydrolase-fold protein [Acidobacteriaceae bacterium]
FGAVVLGLHHPDRFSLVGDLSGALDLPERRFRYTAPLQSLRLERAFGAPDSPVRRDNDPFLLLNAATPPSMPAFFISCGDKDSLLAVNERFNSRLARRSLPHEFQVVPGAHNWSTWNEALPMFESAFLAHLQKPPPNASSLSPGPRA